MTASALSVIIQPKYNAESKTAYSTEKSEKVKGIFSWSRSQTTLKNRVDTYNWIDKLQLNEIYQGGLFRIDESQRNSFISDLKKDKNVDTYYLTGDPSYFSKVESYKKKNRFSKKFYSS
ncbi:hypothetical protein ACSW8U_18815 (plasmid) [Clostridium perfringens]